MARPCSEVGTLMRSDRYSSAGIGSRAGLRAETVFETADGTGDCSSSCLGSECYRRLFSRVVILITLPIQVVKKQFFGVSKLTR